MMLLVVDNGSVFTKNITQFLLEKKSTDFKILPFNEVIVSSLNNFSSFIISGRRKNNKEMNAINSKIINHAISEKKPLLGICYGAEILALTVGGAIRKMPMTQKGNNYVKIIAENPLCSGTIQAYQSHSYEISRLGKSLIQIAKSDACNYEIIQYQNTMIFGTQFHPEMSKDGLSIMEKFVKL
jgi:GMP synthase (glutamine-hydrolysing)